MYRKRLSEFLIQHTKNLLRILSITGIVLIVIFLSPRSEVENQVFLGLSIRRLILGSIFIFFWFLNVLILMGFMIQPNKWMGNARNKLNTWLPIILVLLYATMLVSFTVWVAMLPPVLQLFKVLRSVREQLDALFLWLFIFSSFLIFLIKTKYIDVIHENKLIHSLENSVIGIFIIVTVFFLYAHFAVMIDWVNKDKYSFWDLLAGEFLQGRLYLLNPPYTHDLTPYDGHWYVPMPPLPAILMIPLAYWIGFENINSSYFSIAFSAINGMLVYFILQEIKNRKWIRTSTIGIFLLVALFLFGTPHLWVGISGRGWFVSQIVTVTFLALAIYSALKSWSPWVVGLFIAIAITARPNSLMTWPLMAAISMQILRENQGNISWKQFIVWSMKTAAPIGLAIIGLLFYNYLRFDNISDFGYTTINGAADIVFKAQRWGIFSIQFVARNLSLIFFEMPWINLNSRWIIEPSGAGMSMFLTTPALFYLFHRYPKQWWVIGAWVAIIFNMILLSLYHNTGAHQFGYRYILDFLIPLIIMLAVGMRKQVAWHFVVIVMLSVLINMYGANWFFNG